jgi:membrane-associated phospholipid phosphatase
MRNARNLLYINRYFFSGFILYFLAGLLFLLCTSKAFSFLFLNSYHSRWLDDFFIVYTNLGDGLFSVALVVALLGMRRFNMAWQILAAYVISGLLAQLLKHLVPSPRPVEFFKLKQQIYFIAGVTNTGYGSFPSGHSASIFALATLLAFFSKNKKMGIVYLLAAALVGYSRIYLSQHFLTDVLAGSLVGVLTSWGVRAGFSRWLPPRKKEGQKLPEDQGLARG